MSKCFTSQLLNGNSMESFSRRAPTLKPNQNVFESTMIAFPSPNNETQSAIHQTPDFHNGSALANRFKNDQFNPTSPLCWDSESTIQSHDSEMLLFRPDQQISTSFVAPPPRVGTPNMLDVLHDFQQFKDENKPPSMPFDELLDQIGDVTPSFKMIRPLSVISDDFKSMLDDASKSMSSELKNMERKINQIQQKWHATPPNALSNATLITSEDIRILRTLTQIFSLNASFDVNTCIVQCLKVLHEGVDSITSLNESLNDIAMDVERDKSFTIVKALRKCRQEIDELKETQQEADHLSRKYVDLRQILSFQVTRIQQKTANVIIPFTQAHASVDDAGKAHAEVALAKRQKDLQDEVGEIMTVLPFTVLENSCVRTTISKPGLRFDLVFPVRSGYPWTKIVPDVTVHIGNVKNITNTVKLTCSRYRTTRKPILAICQELYRSLD